MRRFHFDFSYGTGSPSCGEEAYASKHDPIGSYLNAGAQAGEVRLEAPTRTFSVA